MLVVWAHQCASDSVVGERVGQGVQPQSGVCVCVWDCGGAGASACDWSMRSEKGHRVLSAGLFAACSACRHMLRAGHACRVTAVLTAAPSALAAVVKLLAGLLVN